MDAKTVQKVEEDMSFVRQAVEQRDRKQYTSIALAVLWAVIVGTGYTLLDFHLKAAMWFLAIAPVLGFLASFWIGAQAELTAGIERRCSGITIPVHWGSMFVLAAAILSIAYANQLSGKVIGQLVTLISGAVCFLAGLHLDRRFILPGILLAIGSPAIDYIRPYPWTSIGLITAASLIISAIWMKPKNAETNA